MKILSKYKNTVSKAIIGTGLLLSAPLSFANINFCAFDPAGDLASIMKDYVIFARQNNVNINYTISPDEEDVVRRYENGTCDMIAITGVRARSYNSFSGSLDSLGAIPDYQHLKTALKLMSSEKAAKYLTTGTHSIAGILPLGNVYIWTRDLSTGLSISDIAGQSIAVLDYDTAQRLTASSIGLKVIPTQMIRYSKPFISGQADLIVSPAIGYEAVNIKAGVGSKGGRSALIAGQLTYQMVANNSKLSDEFIQKSREFMYGKWKNAMQIINRLEKRLPTDQIYNLSQEEIDSYLLLFTQIQNELVRRGYYNSKTMNFLKKIRCRYNKQLIECR